MALVQLVLCLCVSALTPRALAAPAPAPRIMSAKAASRTPIIMDSIPSNIVLQSYDLGGDGSTYKWNYETDGGHVAEAESSLDGGDLMVRGSYSYPVYASDSDGARTVTVDYVADRYGFQPFGPHIHKSILEAVAMQVAEAKHEGIKKLKRSPPTESPPASARRSAQGSSMRNSAA